MRMTSSLADALSRICPRCGKIRYSDRAAALWAVHYQAVRPGCACIAARSPTAATWPLVGQPGAADAFLIFLSASGQASGPSHRTRSRDQQDRNGPASAKARADLAAA